MVAAYRELVESGEWDEDPQILAAIRMKPIRTLSGVTTITVLTKPSPCPVYFAPPKAICRSLIFRMNLERGAGWKMSLTVSRLKALHEVSTPPTRSSCSFWAVVGLRIRAVTVNGSSAVVLKPSIRENALDDQGEIRLEDVNTK